MLLTVLSPDCPCQLEHSGVAIESCMSENYKGNEKERQQATENAGHLLLLGKKVCNKQQVENTQ